ncbi:MAG: hypothetical protein ACTHOD_12560 [Motilibacteraceae bacterium]
MGVSLGRRGRIVGVGAGLAVAVAGVGVGAAYATSGAASGAGAGGAAGGSAAVQQVADSTTPPSGAPQGDHHRPPMRDRALRLGAAVEHGELVVRAKDGVRTVTVQHGKVIKKADGSLTVESEDGTRWSYVLDDKTHVRKDGEKAAVGDLAKDDEVRVFAVKEGDTLLARLVLDGRPPRPMHPGAPGGQGAPGGPAQGEAPSTAPGATPSGLEDLPGMELLGA